MSGIAALAFLSAAAQGVLFECKRYNGADNAHFSVFVPTSKATDAYRVDPSLYRSAGSSGFEKIDDRLPEQLNIHWRREHNSPVVLTISDYDVNVGIANYRLSTERNPASALYTPIKIAGTCTARAVQDSKQ